MTDRVLMFSRTGRPLCELDVAVTRSWRPDEYGQATFEIAVSDSKAVEKYLKYNNLLVVQTDNGIGDWVGPLWPPKTIDAGVETIRARSAEWLLGQRLSNANDIIEVASLEELLTKILVIASQDGRLPFGKVDVSRLPHKEYSNGYNWHYQNLYEAWRETKETGRVIVSYRPEILDDGTLEIIPVVTLRNFAPKYNKQIIEGLDIAGLKFTEDVDGDFANKSFVFGEVNHWNKVYDQYAYVPESQAEFGIIETVSPNSGTDNRFLVPTARQAMAETAFPLLTIDGTMIGRGNYPAYGMQVEVVFASDNELTRSRGGRMDGIVDAIGYSPDDDGLAITIRELPRYAARLSPLFD